VHASLRLSRACECPPARITTTAIALIGLGLASHTASADVYCPGNAQDMNDESTGGNVHFVNGGWTIVGDGRVSSKAAFNLLGGYMSWDMDVSKVNAEVNTNFYTSSPDKPNCGGACYCDIQKSASGKPSCMELDFIENNGQCAMATTLHTFATDGKPNNGNCDRWGCAAGQKLPAGGKLRMKATVGADGGVVVTLNGASPGAFSPAPSSASNGVVVSTMASIGAVIESSQWFGWAPAESDCPTGDKSGLDHSVLSISNVVVNGTVVQGPVPSTCANPPAPTPAPPTPPPTPPPPAPTPGSSAKVCPSCDGGACDCSWVGASSCDGPGDGSCCYKCCCDK